MKAAELYQRDDNIRKKLKWSAMAFIAPKVPAPKTEAEKAAQSILLREHPDGYQIHIYSILEMLEEAYEAGKAAAK